MKQPRKTMSNKIEISESDVVEAIKCIHRGFKMKEVCEYLGFKQTTWYARLEEHPEIVKRFQHARQTLHLALADKARQLALEGDKDMLKFLLTRRFNYTEKQEVLIKTEDADANKTREELIEDIVRISKRNKLPISEQVH